MKIPRWKQMTRKARLITVSSAAAALVVAGGVGAATSGDSDANVTGPDADKATAAALKITNGGTANSVERDTENGATWEVEVTQPDGKTVDVRLDENFQLVVVEGDSDNN